MTPLIWAQAVVTKHPAPKSTRCARVTASGQPPERVASGFDAERGGGRRGWRETLPGSVTFCGFPALPRGAFEADGIGARASGSKARRQAPSSSIQALHAAKTVGAALSVKMA